MIKETLFAFIVIFNQSPEVWQEVAYKENITFEQCDKAQHAIWSHGWPIVGYDQSGALHEVDAYCIEMKRLSEPEFSEIIR